MRLAALREWSARAVTRLAWQHAGLLAVIGVAAWDRVALLRWWRAFPGGDTYNFILIAQEILRGSYPIAEKRLPVYPLLLIFARPFADWETTALAVAFGMSLLSLALLYALGRALGISKTALAVGLLAFETITPFLFQSIRGYADTTFIALSLGALLALLRARTWRGAAGAGLLAGLAALTRPEGIVLVPVLMLASLLPANLLSSMNADSSSPSGRRWKRKLMPLTAGALAPLVLFALLSLAVGRPLAPAEYLKDAEVSEFGAASPQVLARNAWALWQSLGADRAWAVPAALLRSGVAEPGAIPQRLWSFLTNPKGLPGFLAGIGLAWLLVTRRRAAFLPILLSFLALSIPIAWWGVRQRFLVVLTPLPFLLLAAGVDALAAGIRRIRPRGHIRPIVRLAPSIPLAALLLLSLFSWRTNNAAEQREVIAKNQGQGYAYYRAVKIAETLPGRIAFAHRSSIALALFGEPDRGRAVFADSHLDARDPTTQWEQVQQWQVQYLVVREDEVGAFPVLTDPAFRGRFSVVEQFEHPQARGGLDRAVLYATRNP